MMNGNAHASTTFPEKILFQGERDLLNERGARRICNLKLTVAVLGVVLVVVSFAVLLRVLVVLQVLK